MNISLTDVTTIKRLLGEQSATPQHSQGQNFLISEEVVEATLLALKKLPKKATELGAGLGVLTAPLAEAGFTVRAIEKDPQLVAILDRVLPNAWHDRVSIVHDDLRTVPWEWEEPYVIVGNIPYNLSGLIFRKLTQLTPAPAAAVFLVQKEVGERVRAHPPDMSLLALAVQLWGEVGRLLIVPPHCFWPQPKVSSELILVLPHATMLPVEKREAILGVAKKFFIGRRKQMGGQLHRLYNVSLEEAATILQTVGLQSTSRPQELTCEQWITLADTLSSLAV